LELNNLYVGIISGIITTMLIYFINEIIKKIFIPWFEEKVYKDVKLEGSWSGKVKYEDSTIEEFTINIERVSHAISGVIISKMTGKIYQINGEFRNSILLFSYDGTNKDEIDRGNFVLILKNNAKELDGYITYYRTNKHIIESYKLVLKK
jgi:hypothetical protein